MLMGIEADYGNIDPISQNDFNSFWFDGKVGTILQNLPITGIELQPEVFRKCDILAHVRIDDDHSRPP